MAIVAGFTCSMNAQEGKLTDYVRSSLYTIILDDHGLMDEEKAAIVKNKFFETPIPDKFNDHNGDIRSFDPTAYSVTDEEIALALGKGDNDKKKKSGGFGNFVGDLSKELASSATAGLVDTTDTKKIPAIFFKFYEEKQIPNAIITKWFNKSDTYSGEGGSQSYFNTDLLVERGRYNATEFQKMMADKSARGQGILDEVGDRLIGNTFVVGLRFNYVSKEEIAKQLSATSSIVTSLVGGASAYVDLAVQAGATVAGKGYVIKATAFLYQLDWSQEVNEKFYNEYYNQKDLSGFYADKAFKLKYLGTQSQWADVQSTIFSNKTEQELIERATVRSIDAAIAQLQKKHEPFRTKTPLIISEENGKMEFMAYIGMKEGVEGGDKFEVLEEILDPATNKTTYKRVDVIKADKKRIWDNRYGAEEEQAALAAAGKGEMQTITATYFTGGGKKLYSGMLIRQID